MKNRYKIAELIIDIDFPHDLELESRLMPYLSSEYDEKSDINISVIKSLDNIEVQSTNLIKLSEEKYFYSTDSTDCIFCYDPKLARVFVKIDFDKAYSDIKIYLYDLYKACGIPDNMLLYNIMNDVYAYICFMHGGFAFHSSSVALDGAGVAFSALSGTGKSTHTSLWLKEFPGSFILNDDTPFIYKGKDGSFYISGAPWAGSTGINKNAKLPLKGLVFLERATDNSISKLSPSECFNPIFEAIRRPLTDDMMAKALDTINDMLLSVPMYRLGCNMNPEAAHVAKKGIYGN